MPVRAMKIVKKRPRSDRGRTSANPIVDSVMKVMNRPSIQGQPWIMRPPNVPTAMTTARATVASRISRRRIHPGEPGTQSFGRGDKWGHRGGPSKQRADRTRGRRIGSLWAPTQCPGDAGEGVGRWRGKTTEGQGGWATPVLESGRRVRARTRTPAARTRPPEVPADR